jgi:hypothetical protein
VRALDGVGCVELATAEDADAVETEEFALAEVAAAETLSFPFPNLSEARSASALS